MIDQPATIPFWRIIAVLFVVMSIAGLVAGYVNTRWPSNLPIAGDISYEPGLIERTVR